MVKKEENSPWQRELLPLDLLVGRPAAQGPPLDLAGMYIGNRVSGRPKKYNVVASPLRLTPERSIMHRQSGVPQAGPSRATAHK